MLRKYFSCDYSFSEHKASCNNFSLRENCDEYKPNREYKDSLFRFIFGREEHRESLLSLYNALYGLSYEDKNQLVINTLENVLYMGMKNEVSFILDSNVVLLEHQSTYNPNMPLKGLLYFAKLYERHIGNDKSLYSPRLIKIPTPQFVVFYNGSDTDLPDKVTLRLSDSFERADRASGFEWTAVMLNINSGHNKELLLKCKMLGDYSAFVDCVRKYTAKSSDIASGIENARKECILNRILVDFLKKHKSEVRSILLTEYDEEKEKRLLARDYREIGFEKGLSQGRAEGQKSII